MESNTLILDGSHLTIQDLISVTRGNRKISISEDSKERIIKSRNIIEQLIKNDSVIYGVTTGFGKLANTRIPSDELAKLQVNLIRSHSIGFKPYIPDEIILGAMVIEINSFCKGASGIRLEIVDYLVKFVNHRVIPLAPSVGSVGASGDLSPLAHIASVLLGEGKAKYQDEILSADKILEKLNLPPLSLQAKEGIALINGTHVLTSYGAHAVYDAINAVKNSALALSLSLEAFQGNPTAFREYLMNLRPHKGQKAFAKAVQKIVKDSEILTAPYKRVQDPYSFRCAPQVHGAILDAIYHCKKVVETELNSTTDNPLINLESGQISSGGNFHGEPIALIMDYLTIALTELGSISERRVNQLLDSSLSGLTPFLTKNPGVNSGLMILQYADAALSAENKILASSAAIDNVPVSANQEDHVSMGLTASKKAYQATKNVLQMIGAEIYTAFQALSFIDKRPSPSVQKVINKIKEHIAPIDEDRRYEEDVWWIIQQVENGEFIDTLERELGDLFNNYV